MSALLPGEMQSGCTDEDYLLNGGNHKTACVLTSGNEEANSSLMVGEFFNLTLGSSWGSKQSDNREVIRSIRRKIEISSIPVTV